MIFAVGTLDSILVYDTETVRPLIVIGNIHYATITDIAWKKNSGMLGVSSSDGYCSFLIFEEGELGEKLKEEEVQNEKIKSVVFRKTFEEVQVEMEKPKEKPTIQQVTVVQGKKKIVPVVMQSYE